MTKKELYRTIYLAMNTRQQAHYDTFKERKGQEFTDNEWPEYLYEKKVRV